MKLYNSKTRQKEPFVPIHKGEVRIYSCGPTVYNYFHIGNARPFIVFDVLRRQFEYLGYKVTFVQNFTDIDDKMIKRANEEGITVKQLGDKFIEEYFIDADNLGIKRATVHPRATEHMEDIIALIQKLIDNGSAYQVGNDVYFSVDNCHHYGCLCGQELDSLESGARIYVDESKKNPLDFVLWKGKKEGEPAWASPFGEGRPGWHIECSAMSMKYLGNTLDIHCGGKDLLFPHHENEKAQSEMATGQSFVNYWVHNGFVNINNEKMSKSKGNFFTVRDISQMYDLEVIRMFMLLVHYRSPINYSPELIEQAASSLNRLYNAYHQLQFLIDSKSEWSNINIEANEQFEKAIERCKVDFESAMEDDLNTADAIASLFDFARIIFAEAQYVDNKLLLEKAIELFNTFSEVLGILRKKENVVSDEVQALLTERAQARKEKNFNRSDEIRTQLKQLGYAVEDTPNGQKLTKLNEK